MKCVQRCAVKVWDMGAVCSTGRAGGTCCPHILPPSEAVTPAQAAPPEEAECEVAGEEQPVLLPGLGMAWGDMLRACGMRFTTRVKPCLLEWEEGTSPGAKMSVTLLRS